MDQIQKSREKNLVTVLLHTVYKGTKWEIFIDNTIWLCLSLDVLVTLAVKSFTSCTQNGRGAPPTGAKCHEKRDSQSAEFYSSNTAGPDRRE